MRSAFVPLGVAVLFCAGALSVPAGAEPTPVPGPVLPTPTPTSSPLVPDLFPDDPTPSPTPSPSDGKDRGNRGARGSRDDGGREPRGGRGRPRGKAGDGNGGLAPIPPRRPGSFSTTLLTAAAARLRALGWSEPEVIRHVYPPFIIAGDAVWVDTWGAPRYGPGPLVRTHEGQDVFCDLGAPVLASESGIVEFAEGGLGGRVARLHRADGSYWYYAHLADWNTDDLHSGARVEAGQVIGYCGNSGNAETTAPHVHFGWYAPGGIAIDPMRVLVAWLEAAEERAAVIVERAAGQRIKHISRLVTQRRFGDAFAPDLSRLMDPGGSLWAAGSAPSVGMFGVAQVALQEAMSEVVPSPGELSLPSVEQEDSDLLTQWLGRRSGGTEENV